MAKKYFKVEVEYTGTKTFHIPITNTMGEREALKYIADNYPILERDCNAVDDMVNVNIVEILYQEEK